MKVMLDHSGVWGYWGCSHIISTVNHFNNLPRLLGTILLFFVYFGSH